MKAAEVDRKRVDRNTLTYIDKQTISRAGDALSGITLATLSHSLPATTGDLFLPILQSTEAVGHNPGINLLAFGANASILTLGYRVSSTASAPTVSANIFAAVLHSYIR